MNEPLQLNKTTGGVLVMLKLTYKDKKEIVRKYRNKKNRNSYQF